MVESNFNKIMSGRMAINELDFHFKENENTALQVLDARPSLVRKLSLNIPEEKEVIVKWLKKDVSKIVYLDPKEYMTDDKHDNRILSIYVKSILSKVSDKSDFSFLYSLKNEPVLKFKYETLSGEEITYYDRTLNVPVSLLAKLDIAFKINDTYQFLKFVDINIQQVNVSIIYSKLVPVISTALRTAVTAVIGENGLCYYEINGHYNAIVDKMTEKVNEILDASGIEIHDIYLYRVYIPNGTDRIYEQQKLAFMQEEKAAELKHKEEMLSLENYEKKAEIHKKYPEFQFGLTEKEKDNAIERYIVKKNGEVKKTVKKAKDVQLTERNNSIGTVNKVRTFVQEKESIPVEKKSVPYMLIAGILLIIIGIIVATVASPAVGCSILAVGIVLIGLWIANKANKAKVSTDAKISVDEKVEENKINE